VTQSIAEIPAGQWFLTLFVFIVVGAMVGGAILAILPSKKRRTEHPSTTTASEENEDDVPLYHLNDRFSQSCGQTDAPPTCPSRVR